MLKNNYIIQNIKHLLIELMIICVTIRNCNAFLVEILWVRRPWISKKKIQMIVAFTNKGIEIHVILFIISSEID